MSESKLFRHKINWEKRGLIIEPQADFWWMRTHGMCPAVEHMDGPRFKVYFAGRNDLNQSHIGWAIIDLERDGEVVEYSAEPVLKPGPLGCFDDNGVVPSSVLDVEGRKYLHYVGFKPGGTTRMDLYGGLAISDDNGKTFERYSPAPTLYRNAVNPYINTAPYVLFDDGLWRMYFVAGTEWIHADLPRYNIQYAHSDDGLTWHREGHVCIDYRSDEEMALAKPCVIKEDGIYKMWFAHKNDWAKGVEYRMGYAESEDGVNWHRDDSFAGIDVSESGWDSEMIEYGEVGEYDGRKFMLYNGNNYGIGGIGLAVEK
jgi:hypothetical protein